MDDRNEFIKENGGLKFISTTVVNWCPNCKALNGLYEIISCNNGNIILSRSCTTGRHSSVSIIGSLGK